MRRLRSKLPPLNSIVTFEAAARHLSFTRAAEELLISREAVSRSVAALEANLGARLFVRRHRALTLTTAGETLRDGVSEGLERIARSVERVRPKAQARHATVWATIALAHFWLTPRLPRFRARHKDIELHVRASDTWLDMEVENIDVALRYGPGQWPGLKAHHLFDTQTFPVCAPSYLASAPPLRRAQDLVRHTLLNLDGDAHADEDWSWWLSESGVASARRPAMVGFDSYADVIEAALDGQGIALGFTHVVDNLLASGALVRPLPEILSKGYGVYAVVPRASMPSAAANSLVSWLAAEARAAKPTGRSRLAGFEDHVRMNRIHVYSPCRCRPSARPRAGRATPLHREDNDMHPFAARGTTRRDVSRGLSALGLGMVSLGAMARGARAAGEIMDVTWQGYDAPELMQSYIQVYGGPPEFSYIASDDETFQKIRAGFTPDVIHPGSYMIRRYYDAGLIQPFDTARLGVWPDLAPGIKNLSGSEIDGQRYFIPAEFGNSSILFRTDMVDAEYLDEHSWKIIYDDRYAGRLAWYDSADATVQVAALMLGYSNIYTLDDNQLKDVAELMRKQREVTRFYWGDVTEMEQAVASGEVVAAYSWNQSLVNLKKQGLPVDYMVPKEGIFAWGSGFVMHKDCKNLDAAYDYIDSWVSPESGAWMIDNYGYGSANLRAYEKVAPERLAELGFSDPEGMLEKTIFFEALEPEYEQKYQALYEEIRAGG